MAKATHPVEIEAKIKIDENLASEIVASLAAEGYPYEGMEELNTYFDREGKIKSKGQALRVRRLIDGGSNATHSAVLTFKGPIHKDIKQFKSRPESEIKLTHEDADRMELILSSLGFKPSFAFNKRRAQFKLPKATVCVDYLPGIGHYLEVEGENEQSIKSILSELGFSEFKSIKKGYPSLLEEHAKQNPKDFPNPQKMLFKS